MSITRMFAFGVRWIGGDLASGLRRSGAQFHDMVEKERADLKRLNSELAYGQSFAKKDQQNVIAARRALSTERREVAATKRELRTLTTKNADWREWERDYKAHLGRVQQIGQEHRAARQKDVDLLRKVEERQAAVLTKPQQKLAEVRQRIAVQHRRLLEANEADRARVQVRRTQATAERTDRRRLGDQVAERKAALRAYQNLPEAEKKTADRAARLASGRSAGAAAQADLASARQMARDAREDRRAERAWRASNRQHYAEARTDATREMGKARADEVKKVAALDKTTAKTNATVDPVRSIVAQNQQARKAAWAQTVADVRADRATEPGRGRVSALRQFLSDATTRLGFRELGVNNAQQTLAQQQALNAAKAAEIKAINDTVKSRRLERAAINEVRTGIKQQVWGSIMQASLMFGMATMYLRRVFSVMGKAAEYHYRAQGLSTLLGEHTGSGQDIYANYARRAKYQSEVSPTEAVGRMGDLAAAGYSKAEIGPATEAIFNTLLAARGEITTAGAFDLGISLDKAFGGQGRNMSDLLDSVVMTANKFPMTVGKVRDAMSYATEAAVMYDQSLEETLIAIGTVMPVVKTPSKAGTVVRNAMMSMGKKKGIEILAQYGISPKDAYDNMRPVLDVYLDLIRGLEKADDQQQEKLQAKRAAVIARAGSGQVSGLSKEENKKLKALQGAGVGKATLAALADPKMLAGIELAQVAGMNTNQLANYTKKLIKEESRARLRMTQKQVEYEMTGQRGGAITAGVQRAPNLAGAALRGTPFEGRRFASRDDAIEIMRMSIADAAGEARRMSDELRKTSKVLGDSFKVSLERASVTVGTFMLPARDMMMQMAKTVLDFISRNLPGGTEARPGGSILGNLAGVGAAGLTTFMGVKTVGTLLGSLGQLRFLTSDKFIAATAKQMEIAGMTMSQAMVGARNVLQTTTPWYSRWAGAVGSFAMRFIGWGALIGGAIFGIKMAFDTAANAVTDYTHITDRKTKFRQARTQSILKLLLDTAAEGDIGLKTGADGRPVVTGLTKQKIQALRGAMGGTGARMLGAGAMPNEVIDWAFDQVGGEISKAYSTEPEERKKRLQEWAETKKIFLEENANSIFEIIQKAEKKGGQPALRATEARKWYEAQQVEGETRPVTNVNQEVGGRQESIVYDFMKTNEAKTLDEALEKAGYFAKLSFHTRLSKVQLDAAAKAQGADWFPTLPAAIVQRGAHAVRDYKDNGRPTNIAQWDANGVYQPGTGNALNPLIELSKQTSIAMSSEEYLKKMLAASTATVGKLQDLIDKVAPAPPPTRDLFPSLRTWGAAGKI